MKPICRTHPDMSALAMVLLVIVNARGELTKRLVRHDLYFRLSQSLLSHNDVLFLRTLFKLYRDFSAWQEQVSPGRACPYEVNITTFTPLGHL
jgi:hypothetical protein